MVSTDFTAPTAEALKAKAEPRLDTLETFVWPGGQEAKPRTNKNHMRLYSHNLCPFSTRARYALAAKGIEV